MAGVVRSREVRLGIRLQEQLLLPRVDVDAERPLLVRAHPGEELLPDAERGLPVARAFLRPGERASELAYGVPVGQREPALGGSPLRVAREAVVGDRLPHRRIRDELAEARTDAGILVECGHADGDRTTVGALGPEVCATK